jgi:hypothetical protein
MRGRRVETAGAGHEAAAANAGRNGGEHGAANAGRRIAACHALIRQ